MAWMRDRTRAILLPGFRLRRAAIPGENTGVLKYKSYILILLLLIIFYAKLFEKFLNNHLINCLCNLKIH